MKNNRGMTLLEVLVAVALLAVIALLAGGGIVNMMRISARERSLLEMDQDANRGLEGIKHILRSAYIPVSESPLNIGRKSILSGTSLRANTERWRDVLNNGTDMIVFLTGIDTQGDGDIIYGGSADDKRLILGVDPYDDPSQYVEATDEHDTLGNLGIVDLNPLSDLGLATTNTGPINIANSRFADTFVYPTPSGGRAQIYGVIRFKPVLEHGTDTVTLTEATLKKDLNFDRDDGDEFVLGRIEVVYPRKGGGIITKQLTGNTVLLQINRDDTPQDSIFQLVQDHTGRGNTIKINLLFCNYLDQRNSSTAFGFRGYDLLSRAYETSVKTQLMMMTE